MPRKYHKTQRIGFKICNRCEQELPATPETFLRDSSRADGLAYECRACHRDRKRGRDRRKERWSNMTPEQKKRRKISQKRYAQTTKGRAVFLRKAYEKIDACDLTTDEIAELITRPCIHCGTTAENRGLDRIDNSRSHIRGNVVPSCAPCNFTRGDRFTFDEMQIIGKAIRSVLDNRAM